MHQDIGNQVPVIVYTGLGVHCVRSGCAGLGHPGLNERIEMGHGHPWAFAEDQHLRLTGLGSHLRLTYVVAEFSARKLALLP